MARPPYGSVSCHQCRPSRSCKGSTLSMRRPRACSAGRATMRTAARLKQMTRPCSSATTSPSGSWSGSMPSSARSPGRGAGGRAARCAPGALLVPTLIPVPHLSELPRGAPCSGPAESLGRVPGLVSLLVHGDGAAPSGGALCTCRRIETYGGGGGQVQALGLSVDGDADDGVGEGAGLLGEPPGLVAEDPGGGAAHGALV